MQVLSWLIPEIEARLRRTGLVSKWVDIFQEVLHTVRSVGVVPQPALFTFSPKNQWILGNVWDPSSVFYNWIPKGSFKHDCEKAW